MAKQAPRDPAGKRVPLMVRTTTGLRSKLNEAADASGRSLAQEVELRLERSFEFQKMMDNTLDTVGASVREVANTVESRMCDMVGGDAAFSIWVYLGRAISAAEWESGKSFFEDEATRHDAEQRILSRIPHVFRNPPAPWSEFKKREGERPEGGFLSELGSLFGTKPEPADEK